MLDDLMDDSRSHDAPDEPRRRRRRGGRLRRTLVVLLCLLLLVLAGVGGYAGYLNSKVDDIAREDLLPSGEDGTGTTTKGEKLVTGEGTNYLVVGSDSRGSDTGRSDVIQLVHIPKDNQGVYLIHFPRDLWVEIPGRGEAKINAAYAYGGTQLLVRTIQDLVGVKVDHVAKTDFEGFKDMTDAVGGVRVYAEEASSGKGNGGVAIKQGWNDLDGEQALGFVRERYELKEGDISRGRRQQAWLKGIMTKALSPGVLLNPVKFSKFVEAGTSNSVVDRSLTTGDMRDQALELRGLRGSDIHFITAPFDGYGTSPDGQSIDVLDEAGMEALGDALRSDTMDEYSPS